MAREWPGVNRELAEAVSTLHFALGIAVYLVHSVAVNALLNGCCRTLGLVDALLLSADLVRMQAMPHVASLARVVSQATGGRGGASAKGGNGCPGLALISW